MTRFHATVPLIDTGFKVSLPLAGIASRLLASWLDMAIILLLTLGCLLILLVFLQGFHTQTASFYYGILPLPSVLYPWLAEWLTNGKTIGKCVFNIRVVKESGQPLGFLDSGLRHLIKLFETALGGLSVLWLLVTGQEKHLADRLCGTLVIREEEILFSELKHPGDFSGTVLEVLKEVHHLSSLKQELILLTHTIQQKNCHPGMNLLLPLLPDPLSEGVEIDP